MTDWVDLAGSAAADPIVFLHGAGSNRGMWRWQLDALSDDHRVIVPDLPGHGAHPNRRFRFDETVDATREVIDRYAGGRALVVGLSLGGYIGIGLAATTPDRVSGLVLSGATAEYLGWGGFSTRLYGGVVRVLGPLFRKAAERSIRTVGNQQAADATIGIGISLRPAAQAMMWMPGRDFHTMAETYTGPTLILNGERDKPNRGREADAAARWGADLVVLEDCGHACGISRPEAFTDAVRSFAGRIES